MAVKGISSKDAIGFFKSVSNRSKWLRLTAGDARRFDSADSNFRLQISDFRFSERVAASIEGAVTRRLSGIVTVIALAGLAAGCAAARAFRDGNIATKAGDLDQAVAYYRTAAQAAPDNPNYKIALERAMLAASRAASRRAPEPSRRRISSRRRGASTSCRASTIRRTARRPPRWSRSIRRSAIASKPRDPSRPSSKCESARGPRRPPPMLNPASREPLIVRFNAASLRDILNSIGNATGINVTYDRDVQDRAVTVQLDGRHARAGARAAADHEPAVVQGALRSLDLRVPGHAAEARAVRRSGRSRRSTSRTRTRRS